MKDPPLNRSPFTLSESGQNPVDRVRSDRYLVPLYKLPVPEPNPKTD